MSNVSVSKRSNNGNNKGIIPLSTRFPSIDDLFDRFASNLPFISPNIETMGATELTLNPKIDVVEDDKSYTLSAELPGLDLDDINLDLSDGVLTLSGDKKIEKDEKKNGNYHVMERSYGYFRRSFSLPPSIEEDKIKADFKKGVLNINMPKSENAQKKQRKVPIKG
jgi:HSP20 family protein